MTDYEKRAKQYQAAADAHHAAGDAEHRKAAEDCRSLGALALPHDTEKAIDAFREATRLDPDHPKGWEMLSILAKDGELEHAQERLAEIQKKS